MTRPGLRFSTNFRLPNRTQTFLDLKTFVRTVHKGSLPLFSCLLTLRLRSTSPTSSTPRKPTIPGHRSRELSTIEGTVHCPRHPYTPLRGPHRPHVCEPLVEVTRFHRPLVESVTRSSLVYLMILLPVETHWLHLTSVLRGEDTGTRPSRSSRNVSGHPFHPPSEVTTNSNLKNG